MDRVLERILTPKDIADELKLNVKTVDRWLKTGYLKGFKVGRLWRVREKDLIEFVNKDEEETIIYPCYEEELSEQCLKDIEESKEQYKRGEFMTLEEAKRRLNIK